MVEYFGDYLAFDSFKEAYELANSTGFNSFLRNHGYIPMCTICHKEIAPSHFLSYRNAILVAQFPPESEPSTPLDVVLMEYERERPSVIWGTSGSFDEYGSIECSNIDTSKAHDWILKDERMIATSMFVGTKGVPVMRDRKTIIVFACDEHLKRAMEDQIDRFVSDLERVCNVYSKKKKMYTIGALVGIVALLSCCIFACIALSMF